MKQRVFSFGLGEAIAQEKELKNLLGGKGANLAQMGQLGFPVPPGITLSTQACLDFYQGGKNADLDPALKEEVIAGINKIEKKVNKKFGDLQNPLLLSIRSGARVSMPGMMDTILNLGLNKKTVLGLSQSSQNERFAWDSYRRFIQMYSNVVLGISASYFEVSLEDTKEHHGVKLDSELSPQSLKELVDQYKLIVLQEKGLVFPEDPWEQLWNAIKAVFYSWNNKRAIQYRKMNNLSDSWGTAVNIQAMVFGNMGNDSGTGVAFSRNPSTGERIFFGEFLLNAQGEDVVSGVRNPWAINQESKNMSNHALPTMQACMPREYVELVELKDRLEKHYRDMQDIEFTVERGKLYLLQTRNGKRDTQAGIKIAVDMVKEGLISQKEAILRISPLDLNHLFHPKLNPNHGKSALGKGLPASPGAACGQVVLSSEEAIEMTEKGVKVILVRQETSPEDIGGMGVAQGIFTSRGGMTSHAAVVARGMGKPCVCGCADLFINEKNKTVEINGHIIHAGDWLTIDGSTGDVYAGKLDTVEDQVSPAYEEFMQWVDSHRKLKIRVNADTPTDCLKAISFGAEGIGLCRTEHMFFDPERLQSMRELIFSSDSSHRIKALEKIRPFQEKDFEEIFSIMKGKSVNIRLLDPPLHEFLPKDLKEKQEFADRLRVPMESLEERIESLVEYNPMLGHRGCRLGLSHPEIYRMQIQAILNAWAKCLKNDIIVSVEIMIPFVFCEAEFAILRKEVDEIKSKAIGPSLQKHLPLLKVGTMIELPRACLMADKLAPLVDFFSFGTNDLTQTTFGISRDDAQKFLNSYYDLKILAQDPFVTIDQEGVGQLIQLTCENGRKANSKIHIGICGEHGGDPKSVEFFHKSGLDYVSCSPYRIPIARLAAAQAVLRQ